MEFGSFMEFHSRQGKTQAEAFAESFAHVDQAEAQGLDAVWLAESHFQPERAVLSSPMVVAAAIAGRTHRVKIGTAVQVIPLTNPLRMAEEVATLDHICQGRLEFGIGRSAVPTSYLGYGINYAESRDRFFEYLNIMRAAWTQERFSYTGRFFSYDNVCLTPKPYQQPYPPIRVAATTDDTFPMLGDMGLPIFVGLRQVGLPQLVGQVAEYRKAYKAAGHPGEIDVSLRVPVYVAENKANAINDPEESFMRQFRRLGNQLTTSIRQEGSDHLQMRADRGEALGQIEWPQVIEEKVAVGTPEMVVDRIHELREKLSLTSVVAEFNAGERLAPEAISRSLRLFCEKVAPAFK
ncbi:MAG TPA: LLM class flavin-dependent oxidoreductase [Dehalococcoidia bacterium]|nr:LLM class flavin-dependent oxidoreductase [Dehalococcoidia bacterium]